MAGGAGALPAAALAASLARLDGRAESWRVAALVSPLVLMFPSRCPAPLATTMPTRPVVADGGKPEDYAAQGRLTVGAEQALDLRGTRPRPGRGR